MHYIGGKIETLNALYGTDITAARIPTLSSVKLSANWMAAAGYPGEDAALYDTVHAVGMELCPALGLSIPVGKDSLSMQTRWDGQEVVSPLSLIVSAFSPVDDARHTLTPQLRTDAGDTELLLIDLGCGRNRLGGSILAQVHGMLGEQCPDLDDPALLKGFFEAMQELRPLLLAYHDRSDGGLFTTVCEMAFAAHCGVTVNLDALTFDAAADDVDAFKRNTDEQLAGRARDLTLAALFNEELGAVIQIRAEERPKIMQRLREAGLGAHSHVIGQLNNRDEIRFLRNGRPVYANKRDHTQRIWGETTYRMQALRDHPESAREEFDRIIAPNDPGLSLHLTFQLAAPAVHTGARPRVRRGGFRRFDAKGACRGEGLFLRQRPAVSPCGRESLVTERRSQSGRDHLDVFPLTWRERHGEFFAHRICRRSPLPRRSSTESPRRSDRSRTRRPDPRRPPARRCRR